MMQHAQDPTWHRYVQRGVDAHDAIFDPTSATAFRTTIPATAFVMVPLVGRRKPLGVLGALRIGGSYTFDRLELRYCSKQYSAASMLHSMFSHSVHCEFVAVVQPAPA